jgi:hypothetical protein
VTPQSPLKGITPVNKQFKISVSREQKVLASARWPWGQCRSALLGSQPNSCGGISGGEIGFVLGSAFLHGHGVGGRAEQANRGNDTETTNYHANLLFCEAPVRLLLGIGQCHCESPLVT